MLTRREALLSPMALLAPSVPVQEPGPFVYMPAQAPGARTMTLATEGLPPGTIELVIESRVRSTLTVNGISVPGGLDGRVVFRRERGVWKLQNFLSE